MRYRHYWYRCQSAVASTQLIGSSQQITQRCSSNRGNSLVATGRDGIPHKPNEQLNVNNTWSDIRDLSAFRKLNNNAGKNRKVSNQRAIVEATGFIRNSSGEIELVAAHNMPFVNNQSTDCSGKHT